ncbi:MAG: hypothetical protein D6720_00940 [Gammaproteobacteria bacterium]|nr:MAG: hypothetical protein D6720_00940 [Gammaproteobacteria bacterium]
MQGIDPQGYLQQVALQLESLQGRAQIETVLDEVEYLYEVIPPDFQDMADVLIERLRERLAACDE